MSLAVLLAVLSGVTPALAQSTPPQDPTSTTTTSTDPSVGGGSQPPVIVSPPDERDFWDGALLTTSLLAFATGTITFVATFLRSRRRPEIKLEWELKQPDGSLVSWAPDHVPTIPSTGLEFNVHFQNIGDALMGSMLWNLVVPDCLAITCHKGAEEDPGSPSTDWIAGVPPRYLVRRVGGEGPLAPGSWQSTRHTVEPSGIGHHRPEICVYFDVTDAALNATGRRRLPSFVSDFVDPPPTDQYPPCVWPPPIAKRGFHKIKARPEDELQIGPGHRGDLRRIRFQ